MTRTQSATTVLVVDDEALFRASVCDTIADSLPSYVALQAADGRDALEQFDATSVDVVVTDINMPGMNGLELLLALRDRNFRGPILVVTAFGSPHLEDEVGLRGAFGYHEKPIDLPRLIEAIRDAAEGECSHIEGLTLAGFVQLLELERKTCRLRVARGDRLGDLLFRDGKLIDARLGRLSGEEAALEILGWEDGANLDLHSGIRTRRQTIHRPLSHLLLEAMHRQDEEAAMAEAAPGEASTTAEVADDGNLSVSLQRGMRIDGAIGIALVDCETGKNLGHLGGGEGLNLDLAAAGNTAVLRSKLKVMRALGLDDSIDDILISLDSQYHLIRPLAGDQGLFLYLALDRKQASLALARHTLTEVESCLVL